MSKKLPKLGLENVLGDALDEIKKEVSDPKQMKNLGELMGEESESSSKKTILPGKERFDINTNVRPIKQTASLKKYNPFASQSNEQSRKAMSRAMSVAASQSKIVEKASSRKSGHSERKSQKSSSFSDVTDNRFAKNVEKIRDMKGQLAGIPHKIIPEKTSEIQLSDTDKSVIEPQQKDQEKPNFEIVIESAPSVETQDRKPPKQPSQKGSVHQEYIVQSKDQPKEPPKQPEIEQPKEPEKQPGFLSRLFGRSSKSSSLRSATQTPTSLRESRHALLPIREEPEQEKSPGVRDVIS